MPRRPRLAVIFLPFLLIASAPYNNTSSGAEYYYSFTQLKNSASPRAIKLIRVDNLRDRKSILDEGFIITFRNRDAKKVSIAGNFSNWLPVRMERGGSGVWFYFLPRSESLAVFKYKFISDGIWTCDPKNPDRGDDGYGSYVSIIQSSIASEGKHISYRAVDNNMIEFRIFSPGARFISIVGDFNNWNPENDILEKGNDGIWRKKKRLSRGVYRYKYIIDGEWKPDYYNRASASDDTGAVCSVIKIK
jgi:hypothetical protein